MILHGEKLLTVYSTGAEKPGRSLVLSELVNFIHELSLLCIMSVGLTGCLSVLVVQ